MVVVLITHTVINRHQCSGQLGLTLYLLLHQSAGSLQLDCRHWVKLWLATPLVAGEAERHPAIQAAPAQGYWPAFRL